MKLTNILLIGGGIYLLSQALKKPEPGGLDPRNFEPVPAPRPGSQVTQATAQLTPGTTMLGAIDPNIALMDMMYNGDMYRDAMLAR